MRQTCFFTARRALALAALLAVAPRPAGAAEAVLRVTSGSQTLTLTPDDVRKLPHIALTTIDPHPNASHAYSGVPMRDLLAKVGAPLGERMRGPALRLAVVFHAADSYVTVFALAEFDEAFSSRQIILADAEDGKPLPPDAGPYRLVVPGDKRAARWARMITSIEVVSVDGTTSRTGAGSHGAEPPSRSRSRRSLPGPRIPSRFPPRRSFPTFAEPAGWRISFRLPPTFRG